MMQLSRLTDRYQQWKLLRARSRNLTRIQTVERELANLSLGPLQKKSGPVVFFIASSHLDFFGISAGIGLVSSWALRLTGAPIRYYVCQRGMTQCVLGSNRHGVLMPPPCDACVSFRRQIYPEALTDRMVLSTKQAGHYRLLVRDLPFADLCSFEHDGIPFGQLCLPSLRWVERRYTLEPTPFRTGLLREYVVSALGMYDAWKEFVIRVHPRTVVLFNGTHYPEAVAYLALKKMRIPTVTYESGYGQLSAFFSYQRATEYVIDVPDSFVMGDAENAHLDRYLEDRQRGKVMFNARAIWPDIRPLPDTVRQKMNQYQTIVPIFTNVMWDTSQVYANRYFSDLLDWLGTTLELAKKNRQCLFVVRAHPDELRAGKPSRETMRTFMESKGYLREPNILFLDADVPCNSYELLAAAQCCLVYNSTIGLEAAALGKRVLCGGYSRYHNASCCEDISSAKGYVRALQSLLKGTSGTCPVKEKQERARRYFYFSVFHASLNMSSVLQPIVPPEVMIRSTKITDYHPDTNRELKQITDGILRGTPFYV